MPSRQTRQSVLSVGASCFSCHRRHGIQARTKSAVTWPAVVGPRARRPPDSPLRHEHARVLRESSAPARIFIYFGPFKNLFQKWFYKKFISCSDFFYHIQSSWHDIKLNHVKQIVPSGGGVWILEKLGVIHRGSNVTHYVVLIALAQSNLISYQYVWRE
jgi:hypothetical protein